MPRRWMKKSIRNKLLALIIGALGLSCLLLAAAFYWLTTEMVWESIQRRAIAVVGTGVLSVDPALHQLVQHPADRDSKDYQRLQQQLENIRQASGVTFVYTMRWVDDKQHMLVADADIGQDEIPYGTVYPNDQWTKPAYAGNISYRSEPFIDPDFGPMVEAFAPLRDETGKVVGLLGIDIAVSDVQRMEQILLALVMGFSLVVAAIFIFFSVGIARRITDPVVGVTAAIDSISEVAQGTDPELIEEALSAEEWQSNYGRWLPEMMLHRQDETGSLARSFVRMKGQLKDTFRALAEKSEENEAYRQELIAQLEENEGLLQKIRANYMATVQALANAIEAMDQYTEGHCERVAEYALKIARRVGLDEDTCYLLEVAARLHDIGKIAVPTEVLNKPDKLTSEEMEIIRRHPQVGHDILGQIPGMEKSREIILQHHEMYDGGGYPQQLPGGEVVECARILALADSFDAMTSSRPYRVQPLTLAEAIRELRKYAGSQFDPALVEVLVEILLEEGTNNP